MNSEQVDIPCGWGKISVQIFGDTKTLNAKPIIALHGFLDNSNSFKPIAPYITQNEPFYLIAVDLPGMGFSSHIPEGIPYSTKFYLMCVRRIVMHFELEKFIFLTHSFGCSIALAYSACYSNEIIGLVLLDFAMRDCDFETKDSVAECWKEGIETYLKSEKSLMDKEKLGVKKPLTYEHALKRLLESNKHIDESAAKVLLERGLITINNNLQYTRDIKLVAGTSLRDYHSEYNRIYESLFENLENPVMLLYATPPAFGEKLCNQVMHIMNQIKKNSKSEVELIPFEGTHHFHMVNPEEASKIILEFLKRKLVYLVETTSVVIEEQNQ